MRAFFFLSFFFDHSVGRTEAFSFPFMRLLGCTPLQFEVFWWFVSRLQKILTHVPQRVFRRFWKHFENRRLGEKKNVQEVISRQFL